MKYRREIDGLRAVAVLPVMLFHAGFTLFGGGFVGVDVFFVISGYLITTLIITEKQEGRFSIVTFYERRARRILPALFLVILASIPLALLVMLPYQLKDFARSIIAVNLFVSNIFFWLQGGYFAGPNGEVPLLHTWSLGIEEQYYAIFPLFIIIAWRGGVRTIAVIIAAVALFSLGIAQWASHAHYLNANFYLMPSRAWELLVGSLSALYLNRRGQPNGPLNQIASIAGVMLILYAVFAFDESTPFPSLWALAPVGGTALIILFCTPNTWVHRFLSLRVLVGIGLISYSAYLWHQPLLAFARIQFGTLSPIFLLGILGLSILLAWVSWRFVERPFRNRAKFTRYQIFSTGLATSVVVIAVSGWVVSVNGFSNRYPQFQQQIIAYSRPERAKYVTSRYSAVANKPFTGKGNKLLLIGDSFSQDFYNEILETRAFSGFQISTINISAKCQIYYGSDDISRYIQLCKTQNINQAVLDRAQSADVVILAASWVKWAAERLPETLRNFRFRKDQQIFVIGTKGFGKNRIQSLLKISQDQLSSVRVRPSDNRLETNRIMATTLPKDIFVNVIKTICGQNNECPLFTPSGELISYDGSHLTQAGVKYIGALLFRNTPLKEFAGPTRVAN